MLVDLGIHTLLNILEQNRHSTTNFHFMLRALQLPLNIKTILVKFMISSEGHIVI